MTGTGVSFDPGSVLIEGERHRRRRAGRRDGRRSSRRGRRGGRRHRASGDPRAAQLPSALGSAAGYGRVHVAVGLARGLRRPGPQGDDPGDRQGLVVALLHRGPAQRNHVGDGHVEVHGGVGRSGRPARDPRHPRALRGRRGGVRLLRDPRDQPAPPGEPPQRLGRPCPDLGRARAPPLLLAAVLPGRHGHGRGVRHRAAHALVRVDLGGPGVAEALRPPSDRGVLQPGDPVGAHRGGPLRVARRPGDPAHGARRARPWPTARART